MAYTTVAEVQSLFRKLAIEDDTGDEKTNTVVTTEELNQFIADADARINAVLYDHYEVPISSISSPISYSILAQISKFMVAQSINMVLEKADVTIEGDTKMIHQNYGEKAHAMLMALLPKFNQYTKTYEKPKMLLYDATSKNLRPESGSLIDSHNKNTGKTDIFTKGGNNW